MSRQVAHKALTCLSVGGWTNVKIDKGTCNIEVDQIEEGSIMSDYASGPEMSNAGQFLINRCAEQTGRGGTAKPLGQSPQEALFTITTMILTLTPC